MRKSTISALPEEQTAGPETPEDVAILYSWANLPGAKYRDFSASRREFRAQQRAKYAEQQRQTELTTARALEEAARRELEQAQQTLESSRETEAETEAEAVADAEAKARAEETFRRAEERARIEQQEVLRRERTAEALRLRAEAARSEMMEARKRSEAQATRYAEFDPVYRSQVEGSEDVELPGPLTDPYYYTGQVDPAYFASTPGVRTAQATRTSTERKAYVFPVHSGSEELEAGSLQSYRMGTTFAPWPAQDFRAGGPLNGQPSRNVSRMGDEMEEHDDLSERMLERDPGRLAPIQYDTDDVLDDDAYFDGVGPRRQFVPVQSQPTGAAARPLGRRDLHIRPVMQRVLREEENGQPFAPGMPVPVFKPSPDRRQPATAERIRVGGEEESRPAVEGIASGNHAAVNGEMARRQREVHNAALPPSTVPETTQWRAMDRRSDASRRRRDTTVDHRARTTRQPRPEEPLPVDAAPETQAESPVPPAWLSSAEHVAADATPYSYLRPLLDPLRTADTDHADDDPLEMEEEGLAFAAAADAPDAPWRDHLTPTKPPAGPRERWASMPPEPAEEEQKESEEQGTVEQGTVEQGRASERREFSGGADDRGSLRAMHLAQVLAQREMEGTGAGAGIDAAEVDAALEGEQGRPFDQHGARPEASLPGTPDTLQQSRERVASRWFALKGMMGSPVAEHIDAPLTLPLRTPSLSVFSLSGGVGKTSMVATLGRALSSMGEKVLLTDTNAHGLLAYYFGARDLRLGVVRTFTPPPGSTDAPVLLVHCEVDGLDGDEAAQNRVLDEVNRRGGETQRVLVDMNASGLWLAKRLARTNPWVLVPLAPDMNSVLSTQTVERLFAEVQDAEGQPVRPFYVLNQFDPALPLHLDVREVLRRSLGDRLLPVMIHRAPAVSEAMAEGMTVMDYAPGSAVAEDYMNLAKWLRNLAVPGRPGPRGVRWSER